MAEAPNPSIGEVIAQTQTGLEKLDSGIAASEEVERALEEAPPLVALAQEQLSALVETLGRLSQLDGITGAANKAAEDFREGGKIIAKAYHGAVHPNNQEVGSTAHVLWQAKEFGKLRGYGGATKGHVESAVQSVGHIEYSLGQLAMLLRAGIEENNILKTAAQHVRSIITTQNSKI